MHPHSSLADQLDALLPQTQCTRCGYPACRPYADAMASGRAEINRCPPGGAAGIDRLARRLGRLPLPLDPACGDEKPVETLAVIIETDCIGCTKCIQACPVDAIVGAMNLMHTVIGGHCTGCELCVPACPVDCIEMVDAPGLPPPYTRSEAFRSRYRARNHRLAQIEQESEIRRRRNQNRPDPVAAALARAQARPGDRDNATGRGLS